MRPDRHKAQAGVSDELDRVSDIAETAASEAVTSMYPFELRDRSGGDFQAPIAAVHLADLELAVGDPLA